MRLILYCLFVGSLAIVSCNNNGGEVKTSAPLPEQEKLLKDLITTYPDSLLLKEKLIQYYRDNGSYDKAIQETDNVLKKDSLSDRFLEIKATLYFENEDTLNAIKTFEKAITINPLPDYFISLGSLYAQTKNPQALSIADNLLRSPVSNAAAKALFIKGSYYSYSGDKIKALSYFDSCLKINYRDVFSYREKAICLYDLKKYPEALSVLKQSVAVDAKFEEGYFWMGRCYEKMDQIKEAANSYQTALQLSPDYVEAKDALDKIKIK